MKYLLCLAFLCIALTCSAATWTVELYDTYGDGWNGGTLDIIINGTVVLNDITLTNGSGPGIFNFNVLQGDLLTTAYTPGSWPYENRYEIKNQDGLLIVYMFNPTFQPGSLTEQLVCQVLQETGCQVGTQNTAGLLPIYPYYGYNYSQTIYLASQLIYPIPRITKLRYFWNGVSDAPLSKDWTIYLGHTTRTSFANNTAWEPLANLTPVFSGEVDLPAVAGWVEITLDSPFAYDGSSNLIVAVDENTPNYDGSDCKFLSTASAVPRGLLFYDDVINPNPASPPTANVMANYYANITFLSDPYIHLPHQENFDQDVFPRYWTQTWNGTIPWGRWSVQGSSEAGGTPNEMRADWYWAVSGNTRLITSPIKTDGVSSLFVSFKYRFNQLGNMITKLQYSTDLLTWTDTSWGLPTYAGYQSGTAELLIPGLSASHIYLGWNLNGSFHYEDFDLGYLDNVFLGAEYHDVEVVSLEIPEATQAVPFPPRAVFRNNGYTAKTFTASCVIPGLYSDNYIVANLAAGDTIEVEFLPFTPALNTSDVVTVSCNYPGDLIPGNNHMSNAYICLDLDIQAYANNYNLGQFCTFNLSSPDILTPIGIPHNKTFVGTDWIDGAWYAPEYDFNNPVDQNYWRIDHQTGALTLIGQTGINHLFAIAYNYIGNVIYATDDSYLYTLNKTTGAATLIGAFGFQTFIYGLAYDNINQILYGYNGYGYLCQINPSTAQVTEIGPFGLYLDYPPAFAFDQESGYLFLIDNYNHFLYWVDPLDGHAWKASSLPPDSFVLAMAFPYEWGVPQVQSNSPGSLSWDAVPRNVIYMIYASSDPYTGYTLLGSTFVTNWTDPNPAQARKFYRVTSVRADRNVNPVEYRNRLPHADRKDTKLKPKDKNNPGNQPGKLQYDLRKIPGIKK